MTATTKTVKVPNYTAEQTAEMTAAAVAAGGKLTQDACKVFAEKFGKSLRSVIAKTSREQIYQKGEYVTKSGEKVEKKDSTADAIGKILKLSEPDTASLAKANKKALKAIFEALATSKPLDE